ncbi:mitotic checkpoint regulator, MAD2B-interacting-domain-containing protein [Chytriomyces cf. hyalinus JEL632]|nr:mitotic checkpoint regulator, MAD2B-interacting-domain-containing protein [Chytriomyces cf. hyalinus JEL632]
MNLFAHYASDSDSDNDTAPSQTKEESSEHAQPAKRLSMNLPPVSNAVPASSKPPPKKKMRKLIVVDALPEALSDSDGEDTKPGNASGSSSVRTGLFGFLPPPKSAASSTSNNEHTSATTLIPANLRKKLASSSANSKPVAKSETPQQPTKPIGEEQEESFFTFDLPSRDPIPPPTFAKPTVSSTFNDQNADGTHSHHQGQDDGVSSSSEYAYYTESASSSYMYNPEQEYLPNGSSSHSDQAEDGGARYGEMHLDDAALHKLGHRKAGGASVQVVELNHEDQLGGETARMESLKNMSREKAETSAYEHLKPTKMGKAKHNIMALAFEAKAREQQLKEAYADRRQAKSSTQNKYGF